jgi:ribosomal protein S18 acetylase RimI-like enzyme
MIRRAAPGDTERLNELLYQVQDVHAQARPDIFKIGSKKYTTEELEAIIADDRTPIYVYETDGVIRGYAFCIYQVTEETKQLHYRKTLYIDDLCVDQAERRKHIGEALFSHVMEEARKNRCSSVILNVWALNQPAESFYRKMGMQPLKTTMETRIPENARE